MTALALLLARLPAGAWRWLLGTGALAAAALWLTTSAWSHGAAHERALGAARLAGAETARRDAEFRLQAAVDTAASARAARDSAYLAARQPVTNKVIRYATTPAATMPCPDAGGVRLGAEAIAAANAALAAR